MAQDLFQHTSTTSTTSTTPMPEKTELVPPVPEKVPETMPDAITSEAITGTATEIKPPHRVGERHKTSAHAFVFVAHHPVLLIGVLSLLVLGSAVLVPLQLASVPVPQRSLLSNSSSIGTLSFTSSGQLNASNTTGINDQVTLTLSHVAATPSGQQAGVWLLPDPTDDRTQPLLLGSLAVYDNRATLTYTHPQHSNLLAGYSGLEIVQQPEQSTSSTPPLNAPILYQGRIAAIATPNDPDHYSLLDHLRHLLARDPTLEKLGLHGGLGIWLDRNTEKIVEWSSAARDSWNGGMQTALIHRHLLRILDTLDGTAYVELSGDVPAGSPLLIDPESGRIGLLQLSQTQTLPSYLSHVDLHLRGIIQAPGHTQAQQQVADKIDTAIQIDTALLQQVRADARALAKMNTAQLRSSAALALLNAMFQAASAAFVGQYESSSDTITGGVTWIYQSLQTLATFSLTRTGVQKDTYPVG